MSRATSAVVRYLVQVATGPRADLSNEELLDRFVARADEAAFEALVRRLGPMVLGVCRRVLCDAHDAEDAFQATFLVLVRKAGSLRNRDALGPWLYGVAYRTALNSRAARSFRRERQREVLDVVANDSMPEFVWDDLRPVLDEEVNRLPEKYRTPFVLYHLQGLGYEEIERRLGSPRGTVATRLARARTRLQNALSRRGVSMPAGALATLLAGNAAQALPAALVSATVKAASAFALAPVVGGAVTASVAALAKGVLKAMTLAKVKGIAIWLFTVGLIVGAGTLAIRAVALAESTAAAQAVADKADPAGRKGLPQEHEYQRQLRAYLATLTEKDFEPVQGKNIEAAAVHGTDEQFKMWVLGLDPPRVGAKRSAPSVNLPSKEFLLSNIESPGGTSILRPAVWPEPIAGLANWKYPGNPYQGSRELKLRAFVFIVCDLLMVDEQQEHNPAPMHRRADWYGPRLLTYAYTYAGVKDVVPEAPRKAFEAGLKRTIRRLIKEWGPKGEETYLDMTAVTGMAILSKAIADLELNKEMEAYAKKFLTDGEYYHAAGYFTDQGCFDPGFNGLTMYFATWAALASDWPFAKEAVAKSWKLRAHLMLPEPDADRRPSKKRTFMSPTHTTLRTGSNVTEDQWPWAFKPVGASYLTDDAMCQVEWPAEKHQQESLLRGIGLLRSMLAENPRDAKGQNIPNEQLKSSAWRWSLWPGSGQFPMTNFGHDYYPAGFAARRAATVAKNPEILKLPFDRAAPFVETFEKDFLIAKNNSFGAIVHTGPVSEFPGKKLLEFPNAPYGLSGGTLSAFWTPTTGSVILGRRGGMFPPGGVPTNYDKPELWRDWPVHAVIGTTGGSTFFTSARNQKPTASYETKDGKATVSVGGTIPAAPLGKEVALKGKLEYARTFDYSPAGLMVESTVRGDGIDKVLELYEAIPVFHRESAYQDDTVKTKIEFQIGGNWVEGTTMFANGVTAIRLSRFKGAVTIQLDKPRRVKLSPSETPRGFLTAHVSRNVLIDLLESNDQPAAIKEPKTVRFTIVPAG